MKDPIEPLVPVHPALAAALGKIEEFIENATGSEPSPDELAQALTRYFVLKEILAFVELSRSGS